jgi:ribosomal protein S12 methylthiotransferase
LRKKPLEIGFISLGCPKNLVDSEIIATEIFRAGFKLARTPEKSDVLIINTCAFIKDAKREAIDTILNACELKRKGSISYIIVAGCLPQRYRNELLSLFPEVDAFTGINEIKALPSIIRRITAGDNGIIRVSKSPWPIINPPAGRILFTGAPYAYVKIADGCSHHCSFCVIPRIRGKFRSRSVASIIREAADLLSRGIRELNLVAQDVTAYGSDLGTKADLAFLLKQIGRLGGKFWVRILYGHPARISDALLDMIAQTPQVCHYLDIPIQHCDRQILRQMGRAGDEFELRRLFARIRKYLPDVSLRTTCLVGFPGETNLAFKRLLNFIEETEFDHLGVFTYSAEERTKAALFPNQIPAGIARQRKKELMLRQQEIVGEKLAGKIGKTDEILVEKKAVNAQYAWVGRSRSQAPEVDSVVYLQGEGRGFVPGQFANVRYVKAKGYDLIAETDDIGN